MFKDKKRQVLHLLPQNMKWRTLTSIFCPFCLYTLANPRATTAPTKKLLCVFVILCSNPENIYILFRFFILEKNTDK